LKAKEQLEVEEEALRTALKTRLASETQELKRRDDQADETATRTKRGILTISTASILLAFLLGFFISRSIVIPISRLRTATVAMSQGDLAARSNVKSKDEIGELSVSFNHMADSIQKKNEELQTFNEELQTSNEELKSTTEELESTNEELKSTNEEMEASNEELRETQEKLLQQEKLAAVGQLASGVGHELRNPLGVMKNAVYFIKSKVGMEDEKLAKHLKIMEKEIDSATKIISDLLGFSRTRKPAISPNDINHVVEEALSAIECPPNVRISKELNTRLPQAMVDPDQLRQVLLNLALNGIQAMNDGGILTVVTCPVDSAIEVQFKDTGVGIPKENLSKLFDPFFTTKARGIGLGLAVSHGIVERNKGKIAVESAVGKGSVFTVTLPAVG
jgi:signal transduction histidine kinase